MISQQERDLIVQITQSEVSAIGLQAVMETSNPFFLQELANDYNWDDGLEIICAISESKYCDLGVALTIFWLAESIGFLTGEIERNHYNGAWFNLSEKLSARISKGEYSIGKVSFEPPLSKVQKYKLLQKGIPEVFLRKVVGVK
ncbi:DUF4274 domain-containing protein [Vibrio kasasachensis]|uniref:DUF4274 domain-containing protein n=1 Tax=Vibrio kasasachensis TaxID=2910248 RepID=UPI003D11126A